MRLLTALVASALVHIVLIVYTLPSIHPNQSNTLLSKHFKTLSVSLSHFQQANLSNNNQTLQTSAVANKAALNQTITHENTHQKSPLPQLNNETNTDELIGYLPPKELERTALPISNIDTSMLGNQLDNLLGNLFGEVPVNGMPIHLRLYISKFGYVTKIERIQVLEQDEALATQLESLLQASTFIPAKKGGLDVDSYQDVNLDFRAN